MRLPHARWSRVPQAGRASRIATASVQPAAAAASSTPKLPHRNACGRGQEIADAKSATRRATHVVAAAVADRTCSLPPRSSSFDTSAPSLASAPSAQIHAPAAAAARSIESALPSAARSACAEAAAASATLNASPAAAVTASVAQLPAGLRAATCGVNAAPPPKGRSAAAHCDAESPPRRLAAVRRLVPHSAPHAMWLHCGNAARTSVSLQSCVPPARIARPVAAKMQRAHAPHAAVSPRSRPHGSRRPTRAAEPLPQAASNRGCVRHSRPPEPPQPQSPAPARRAAVPAPRRKAPAPPSAA